MEARHAGRGGRCCSGSWSGSIRERRAHRVAQRAPGDLALEVQRATGVPFSAWQVRRPLPLGPSCGLELPRPRLYARIDARVLEQMEAGLAEEVRSLVDRGYDLKSTAMSGFGYREVAAYLRGEYGREEAVARYQQHALLRQAPGELVPP